MALNGVKFEPETNERIQCNTGEIYRIEARQKLVDMGLDFNNAHVQPTGEYHYHGKPLGVVNKFDNGRDLIHIGFAKDGFLIYYSKSGKYTPSYKIADKERTGTDCVYARPNGFEKDYQGTKADGTFVKDWEYVEGLGDLDECNGTTIEGNYAYVVTDENTPYIGRCLNGEFKEERHVPPPNNRQGHERGRDLHHNHHHK